MSVSLSSCQTNGNEDDKAYFIGQYMVLSGDFFGERALLGDEVRTANIIAQAPGVEVLTLDRLDLRESFLKLIGDLEALKRDYGDKERLAQVTIEPPSPTKDIIREEFAHVQLKNIKRLATLGVGGFGRVELTLQDIPRYKIRVYVTGSMPWRRIMDYSQGSSKFNVLNESVSFISANMLFLSYLIIVNPMFEINFILKFL
uniref:Cyclic nucleotide-binding domain-containing protein n=1 Tax=Heterorhabditis bacteriophora TaxID=37862 RepID=A0A1I7WN45_HETBA